MFQYIGDWELILTGKGHNKQETRRKYLFCKCMLDTFIPHGGQG